MEFPVGSVLGLVELEDFTRWQIDLPIQIGTAGTWYRVWGGPRLMFTTFDTALVLDLPAFTGYPGERELASFSGTGVYVGGQAGVALGYQHVFFGFELTMAEIFSSGELTVLGQRAVALDLDSFIVYPSVGLMAEFLDPGESSARSLSKKRLVQILKEWTPQGSTSTLSSRPAERSSRRPASFWTGWRPGFTRNGSFA